MSTASARRAVGRQRSEARLHRLGDAEPARRLVDRRHLRLARGGDVDEDRDEDQQRIAEQAEEAEHRRRTLGRPRRRSAWRAPGRVPSPAAPCNTRPPSIGKAGMRLKMARNRLASARRARSDTRGSSSRASSAELNEPTSSSRTTAMTKLTAGPAMAMANSCDGLSADLLQAGDAADRQQRHFRRLNAVAARDENVTELVQHDADEQKDDEDEAVARSRWPALLPRGKADPREQQQESHVNLDRGAAEAADRQGPAHRQASLLHAAAVRRSVAPTLRSSRGTIAHRPGERRLKARSAKSAPKWRQPPRPRPDGSPRRTG